MKLWNTTGAVKPVAFPGSKYQLVDDPTDLFVHPPERAGVKLNGCMVDREVDTVIQEVIDRGLFNMRNKADIQRTAVTHFVMDQLQPALQTHHHRFTAYHDMLRLKAGLDREDQTARILSEGESLYAKKPKSRLKVLQLLEAYANNSVDESYIKEARDTFSASAVLGEAFTAYINRPYVPDPEEVELQRQAAADKARIDSMGSDDALEALAREQSEEEDA